MKRQLRNWESDYDEELIYQRCYLKILVVIGTMIVIELCRYYCRFV